MTALEYDFVPFVVIKNKLKNMKKSERNQFYKAQPEPKLIFSEITNIRPNPKLTVLIRNHTRLDCRKNLFFK